MALTLTVVNKPKQGTVSTPVKDLSPELVELLEAEVPKALADPKNKEIVLTADTETEASKYAGWARAWGAQQEPPLNIRKIPNRREMKDNQARLTVALQSESAPLGRKPGDLTTEATSETLTPTGDAPKPANSPAPAPLANSQAATDKAATGRGRTPVPSK